MNRLEIGRLKSRNSEGANLEEMILSALRAEHFDVSLADLLDHLGEQGVRDEPAAKSAITRLLAESKIEMTPQRKLRVSARAQCF